MTDRKFVDFEVPKGQHSRLIGKAGATIKQIQSDSGAIIKVPKSDDPSAKVGVEGTQIDKAQQIIEGIIGMKVATLLLNKDPHIMISSGPLVLRELNVPKQKHSIIIGKGGATIKELQAKFGVVIRIPRPEDASSIVSVEGPDKKQVDGAEKAIESLIGMELSGKTMAVTSPDAQTSTSGLSRINLDGPVRETLFMPDNKDGTKFTRLIQYLASPAKTLDVCVFTMTDDRIRDVLMEQVKKGVVVRVISDFEQSKTLGSDVDELKKRGVPVRLDKSPAHMHHKFAILDNKVLITGSFNWTRQASQENRENVLILNDAPLIKAYSAEFESLWKEFA